MQKNLKPEFIEVVTGDKLVLPGLLYEPASRAKGAFLNLHGNGSASAFYEGSSQKAQANALNAAGYAYLALNNRGSGMVTKIRKTDGKKVRGGTAYERIKDCVKDIDAAAKFLKRRGYRKLFLIGYSTGANKICVYHAKKPNNPFSGYVVACGGDDVGIYYRMLGKEKFWKLLKLAKRKTTAGRGEDLVPYEYIPYQYSYRAAYDIMNPDGDYNTFPFLEAFGKARLSKKPLFRDFRKLSKPSLVVYGENDPYTGGPAVKAIHFLEAAARHPEQLTFATIPGADHGFTGKDRDLNKTILNWLREQGW